MAGADLHLHSTASDGRFPPREVVRRAFGADLRAISLTDHDTIAGIAEAAREAIRLQIDLVPGCEISINHDNTEIHLLAYYINPSDAAFRRMLTDLHQAREERLMKIVELLRAQSVPISLADIRREAIGTAAIGRLHIARALVRLKVVKHFGAAFRDWLGFGGKAFVPKQTPHPEAVIDCIWSAGGVPVLAHPGLYRLTDRDEFFADWDLGGIEVDHPAHSPGRKKDLTEWATSRGIPATGGSDWHGNETEESYIGCRRVDLSILSEIRQQIRKTPQADRGVWN